MSLLGLWCDVLWYVCVCQLLIVFLPLYFSSVVLCACFCERVVFVGFVMLVVYLVLSHCVFVICVFLSLVVLCLSLDYWCFAACAVFVVFAAFLLSAVGVVGVASLSVAHVVKLSTTACLQKMPAEKGPILFLGAQFLDIANMFQGNLLNMFCFFTFDAVDEKDLQDKQIIYIIDLQIFAMILILALFCLFGQILCLNLPRSTGFR